MPEFRYRALDYLGEQKEGVIDAMTQDLAVQMLSAQGLRLQSLSEEIQQRMAQPMAPPPVAPQQVPQTVSKPAQMPIAQPASQPRPSVVAGAVRATSSRTTAPRTGNKIVSSSRQSGHVSTVENDVTSPVMSGSIRTKRMTIKQRYMLFAQLGNMLKAGIPPHQAFAQLAGYSRRPDHAAALSDIAKRTAGGTSMADAMVPYVDMFQPGEIGGLRAGEMGGYAPDAADTVSDQLKTMNKFRLWFWWCGLVGLSSLLCVPLTGVMVSGLEASAKTINTTGPMTRGLTAMVQGWGAALMGPPGISIAVILIAYVLFRLLWFRTENLARRHAVALNVPLSSKRAVRENVVGFAWHLERLTRAGLAPNRSWKLASEAVPNVAFARRLTGLGRGMTDESRISDTLRGANVFPEEFWPMVSTGELTGTLPDALNEAAQLSRADMQATESHIKWRAGCWFLILSLGTTGFLYVFFIAKYYDVAIKNIIDQ